METLRRYHDACAELPGWFTEDSAAVWDCLLAFQRAQAVKGHAFEIGVYHGKSAALTALHLRPDEDLVLVDPYRLDQARAKLAELRRREPICHPCRSSRLSSANLSPFAGRCRWVHVDGEHTGFACAHDMGLADRLLDDKGILVVDDFFSPRYPQVTAAVLAYLQAHPFSLRLFLCGFFKAYLARPPFAGEYLRYVRDGLLADLRARDHGERIALFKTTVPDDMNCFGMARHEGTDMVGLDWDKSRILI